MNTQEIIKEIENRDTLKYGPKQECCNLYLRFCRCSTLAIETTVPDNGESQHSVASF